MATQYCLPIVPNQASPQNAGTTYGMTKLPSQAPFPPQPKTLTN